MLYAISYLFSGFNIFGSAFFTGLNNGKNFCDHFHPTYFGDPDTRTADPPDIFRSQRYLVCNYGSRISRADRNWLFPCFRKRKSIIVKLSYYQPFQKKSLQSIPSSASIRTRSLHTDDPARLFIKIEIHSGISANAIAQHPTKSRNSPKKGNSTDCTGNSNLKDLKDISK